MNRTNLSTHEQREAFEQAKRAVSKDDSADAIDADRADRGRTAGDVEHGEVVRILAEAYLGQLEYDG